MSAALAYAYIDGIAITLLASIAVAVIRSAPNRLVAWLVALLVFNAICNTLAARQDYAFYLPEAFAIDFGYWHILLNLARNSTSAVLAYLCHLIFREQKQFPVWLWILIAVQLFLEEPLGWILGPEWTKNAATMPILVNEVIPALLQLCFSCVALTWAILDANADLVEKRRSTRAVMLVLLAGILSLAVERVGFITGIVPIPYAWMYPIHMFILCIQTLAAGIILTALLRDDAITYLDPLHKPTQPEPVDVDLSAAEAQRVVDAFAEDKLYTTMGLSVGDLSSHLSIPEYRLRSLIHDHLGFRNFNTLLHHYRIDDICQQLADPQKNATPILTLALSTGYQSIAPFNRAFRELKGVTPTQFRSQSQAAIR